MLRLILGLAGPLVKFLGITALQGALDELKKQFDRIEQRQERIEARLDVIERKNDAVFHGWELMDKARKRLPHAAAADPRPPGETLQQAARRVARHVADTAPDPEQDEDDEDGDPPESHV